MSVAVVGAFPSHEVDMISLALSRSQVRGVFHDNAEVAKATLPHGDAPQCLFLKTDDEAASQFIAWMRGDPKLFSVPVIAVVNYISQRSYVDAHHWGADDVICAGDVGSYTRRAAAVAELDPTVGAKPVQGRAIVAHRDRGRRQVLGRGLRQMGFDVSFAALGEELRTIATHAPVPQIVVAGSSIADGKILDVVNGIRESVHEQDLPFVLLTAPDQLARLTALGAQTTGIEVASESAPPDDLMFLANELLSARTAEVRQSPRYLHGTLCGFRTAGEIRPVYGYTYNISREGIYVRTFDPPPNADRVWVEMMPPGRDRALHLRADVVWRRPPSGGVGGATPAGFGVRLNEAACPPEDLVEYHVAYDELRANRHTALP
ncbi:MAG: PilZ domain-containing protein [Sandaracinaceae bacterium]|nr:PilZ domain-containing protein [Sandaracinaceae bacterium]